jgi:D-alanine-D-alanine ligase
MKFKKKLRVGVIMGGRSGEHEVSLNSANSVIKALDKNKYEVISIGITKSGKWITGPNVFKILSEKAKGQITEQILLPEPKNQSLVANNKENFDQKTPLDVIFPVLHGTYGEDGKIQGLFELANIPYVGSGVLGSAVGMDKIVMKQLFNQAKLETVKYYYFTKDDWQKNPTKVLKKIDQLLKYPVFVKPANLGSSVGINKVKSRKTLKWAINQACLYDRRIIVEQAVKNCREIECSVLGNDKPGASIPGELVPGDEFYNFEDKYINNTYKHVIPAPFPQKLLKKIQQMSIKVFKLLDLAGLARVDFFIENNKKVIINEVNTMPGFTSISMYPKLWQASGIPYAKLLDILIKLAFERCREKNQLTTEFNKKLKV